MTERLVRLFYASWDPRTLAQCQQVTTTLCGTPCELVDVATHERQWRASGLRTVPAAQVLLDGAVVAQFDGKLPSPMPDAPASPSSWSARIEPLEVVASSGSYRYGRWAEPFVVSDDCPELGWSSASLPSHHRPWIVIDTLRIHELNAIGITPRDWSVDQELKKCLPPDFDIAVSSDGVEWNESLQVRDYDWRHGHPHYWDLECTGRFVHFQAVRLRQRPNGRYVCQLRKLELWGRALDQSGVAHLATGRWDAPDGENAGGRVQKVGIWYEETGGTAAQVWHLPPEAGLPPRAYLTGRAKLLVLTGSVVVHVLQTGEKRVMNHGQWLTQWPALSLSVTNASPVDPATVLEIRSEPRSAEAWTAPSGG